MGIKKKLCNFSKTKNELKKKYSLLRVIDNKQRKYLTMQRKIK